MKKLILLTIALMPLLSFAQKAKKDLQKTSFEVEGVCGMCKNRIEKQAYSIKGVKSASWDIPTHQFSVIYDASKTSLLNIHKQIAAVGHDTPLASSEQSTYDNLPMCCLYERKVKE